jgi:hypothetical protein
MHLKNQHWSHLTLLNTRVEYARLVLYVVLLVLLMGSEDEMKYFFAHMGCLVTYLLRSLAASMGESPSPNPWTPHKKTNRLGVLDGLRKRGQKITRNSYRFPQIPKRCAIRYTRRRDLAATLDSGAVKDYIVTPRQSVYNL